MSLAYDDVTSGGEKGNNDGFGIANSFQPGNEKEAESQRRDSRRGSTILPDGRKMSRIGPPPGTLKAPGSDTDSEDAIGRLVELEAENAIKYRTCSWQKVIGTPSISPHNIPSLVTCDI